jgi:hypothetical protein
MNKFSQSTFFGLFILIIAVVRAEYYHKIEPFSFDLKKFEYPLEWKKWGATVALKKSIKLMPKVENRFGGLWLSQVSIVFIQIGILIFYSRCLIYILNTADRN